MNTQQLTYLTKTDISIGNTSEIKGTLMQF